VTVTVFAMLLLPAALAQSAAFDVASVKPHKAIGPVTEGRSDESIEIEPGSLNMRNVRLSSCIKWAYQVKDYQIAGPDWLHAEKYDIAAKAAGPARTEELREMLQTLLRERFQLQVHRETRELTVYALTVSKSGPKLHKAEPQSNSGMQRVDGTFVFDAMSMPQLADDLSTFVQVDRPVLDRTGIRGVFDFSLKFADSAAELKRVLSEGDGPSIFTVIQEQLGLRLEGQKGPIEILVIDHVERATEN
jgi:uncharacterized protein (TIGR03435 family)